MMLIQIASVFGMAFAVYGSTLFSKNSYRLGSMAFMIGNITNIAVALAVGNVSLALAQAALSAFAITMYSNGLFNLGLIVYGCFLGSILGVSPHCHFRMPMIDSAATVLAIYGAYCMSQKDYDSMDLMWLIADVIFIIVAVQEHLWGLLIQSVLFTHHGFERVNRNIHRDYVSGR